MPFPENVSWDRKDIYRDRRPVNSEPLGSPTVPSRWNRDSTSFSYRGNPHGSGAREFSRRGFTDYRSRPLERGRQQSDWQMFPEERGYGYMPSRSCERVIEDRGYGTRADGRYRSGTDYYKVREYQKDWEGPNWQQNNSISAGKPFNGSPVFYGGKPCNGFSGMPVERRHNEAYPGFGNGKHFNASPVICNGRPSNGFSGASVEKSRNGYSHRNGFSPRTGFSPTNTSDRPFSSSSAVLGAKQCLGYSNPHFDKSCDGFSGSSVFKTHGRINQSFAAERPNNLSPSVSGDKASNVFSSPLATRGYNRLSPHIAADRSNLIPPDISKSCFAPINPAIEKAGDLCSDVHSEKTVEGCSFSISAERSIELPFDIAKDTPNPCASSASIVNRFNGLVAEKLGNGVSGGSSTNICDGIERSRVTDPPEVKINGKLSKQSSDHLQTVSENPSKQHHDIEMGEIIESCNVPNNEKENFLGADWKPLKWTRSGSLSSRGHSSSSRSVLVESEGTVDESPLIISTTICSPSGDAGYCFTSSAVFGEEPAIKKARLGWGQGLAKYEKKVVEDPCGSGKQDDIRSPKVGDKCTSSLTPSVACCSSQDNEFKYSKEGDTSNFLKQSVSDNVPSSFEKLDMCVITNEVHFLLNTIHSEDQFPTGSESGSIKAMSKLLLWKTGILKAVEVTDSEIESLEIKIKSSKSENSGNIRYSAASSLLNANGATESHRTIITYSVMPMPLQADSSRVRYEVDSPGTGTSNPVVASRQVKETTEVENPSLTSMNVSTHSSHTPAKLRHNQQICRPSCDIDTPKHLNDDLSCPNHDNLNSEEIRLHQFIFAANKEEISNTYDELAHLLSNNGTLVAVCQESATVNDRLIRDAVAKRKKLLRFTEKSVTLKYRALQQLWKEDTRLLEMRKNRPKFSKRLELGTKTLQDTHLESNLLHLRMSSTEKSTRLVPSSQTVSLASKLLSDCSVKVYKDELKMPPLILGDTEKLMSRFVSYNGLVEDPVAVENERVVINPWTPDETEMFLDKYLIFGKDFRKIASYIDHKTTADCVKFYYKNHKSSLFERTRKKPIRLLSQMKSVVKNAYMLTSGEEKWNQERMAADVLAGISGSLSSEVINPSFSSSFDHTDVHQQWKRKNVSGKRKRSWTFVTPIDDETYSGEISGEVNFSSLDWSDKEKQLLLQAVKLYGKNFEFASKFVKTRYSNECKAFYSKVIKRLGSTLTATNINSAGIRVDSKPDIDVRLSTPLLETVL